MAPLRRGALAGAIAGACSGLFHLLISERALQRAIDLEAAGGEELFSRGVQRGGLVLGTILVGIALGAVFGLVHERVRIEDPWRRALSLGVVAFGAGWLVPFLKYPADPPGVGDPDTIGRRTAAYLVMVAISIAAALLAWRASAVMRERGWAAHARHPIAVAVYCVAVAIAAALLPGAAEPAHVPASLVWTVRIDAVAGQLVLWASLATAVGILARRRTPA